VSSTHRRDAATRSCERRALASGLLGALAMISNRAIVFAIVASPALACTTTPTDTTAVRNVACGEYASFDGDTLVFDDAEGFAATYRCLVDTAADDDALAAFEADIGGHRSLRVAIAEQTEALVAEGALTRLNLPYLMYVPDPYLRSIADGSGRVRIGDRLVTITDDALGRERGGGSDECATYRHLGSWSDDGVLTVEWAGNLALGDAWLGGAGTVARGYQLTITDGGERLVPDGGATIAAASSYGAEELCERSRSFALYDRVALIQGNFGVRGNFEVVAVRSDGRLQHFYRINDGSSFPWIEGPIFAAAPGGYSAVSMIQSSFGAQGNFEVVAAIAGGLGIEHHVRDNDLPNHPWSYTDTFGNQSYNGVSLIERADGTFQVAASIDGVGLQSFERYNGGSTFDWSPPNPPFFDDIAYSAVSLVESSTGGLDLLTAHADGGLQHLSNDTMPLWPFEDVETFASEVYFDVSMIQSNFGGAGNFEAVAIRPDGSMHHFFRDNDFALPWHVGGTFGAGAWTGAALIQSNYDVQGNFEVVTSLGDGDLRHYYRRNDEYPNFPWVTGPVF
jgi:hypothetical protein